MSIWHCVVTITPTRLSDGAPYPVRVTASNNRRVTGIGGVKCEPALIQAPEIALALFNGDFGSAIQPGAARLPLSMSALKKSFPDADKCFWTGAAVEVRAGRIGDAWPWQVVFSGRVTGSERKAQVLTLAAEVDAEPFNADVLPATYDGTGGVEGGPDIRDRVKPLILGWARNVEPVLVNATDNVYQFSGYGPIEGIPTLYERGSDFGPSFGNYGSYESLVGAEIPPGRWATCLADGLIRLGAPAYGVITGDVRGHLVGASTPRLTGSIITALATIAGVGAPNIEADTLSALDADVPYPVNLVLTEQASFADTARRLALPCGYQAGISLTGKFFVACVDLDAPSTIHLHAQGRRSPQVIDAPEGKTSPPYARMIFGANRNWRVHSFSEIAFNAEMIDRGLYDPEETYREGHVVWGRDKSSWLYINTTPSKGNAPPAWPTTSNAYWQNLTPPTAYADGTPIEDLKPAQPGADRTGDNTSKDTENVGGKPSGEVIDELEQLDRDMRAAETAMAAADQQIAELFATYGHTAAAADSAAIAQQAAQISADAASNADTARQQAEAARTAAEQAETDALTHAQAAGGSASAAAGHAQTASTAADEAAGSATAAAGSATVASTKAGEASVSAGQAATSATNAAGSASSASASASVAASARDTTLAVQRKIFASDFNNGDGYWLGGGNDLTKAQLSTASSVTSQAGISLVQIPGIGTVLQADGTYRLTTERATRPFVEGQKLRLRIRTRLTQNPTPAAGPHSHWAWITGTKADGTPAGYREVTRWSGLTVADGWVTREVIFDPVYLRTLAWTQNPTPADAVEWRLMIGLNGYTLQVGGAIQQIQWITLEDVTSEMLAASEATAAATSASSAAASQSAAGQSASAAQTAATNASTSAGQASTSATQAATSASDAAGSASTASESATVAASARDASVASAVSLFPERLHGDWLTTSLGGSPESVPSLQGVVEGNWIGTQKNILTKGVLPWIEGRIYEVTVIAEGLAANATFRPGVRLLNENYAQLGAQGGGAVETLPVGQTVELSRMFGCGVSAADVTIVPACDWLRPSALLSHHTTDQVMVKLSGLFARDVTARYSAGQSATAAATSASTATARATEAGQSASAAASAKTDAETARGQALTYRNEASQSASNAATSASSASSSAAVAASSATTAQNITKKIFRADFNEGADYWVAAFGQNKNQLPTATNVVDAYTPSVSLVTVAGIGTVLQCTDSYRTMSERNSRPYIAGQRMRVRLRTRLTRNQTSGTHRHYLWVTTTDANGLDSGYAGIVSWAGLTVADGWIVREAEFNPPRPTGATEWRLMVGLNGYNTDSPVGAIQQVEWITIEDITSETAAGQSATAAATSASAASTSATQASGSAQAAQTAATQAQGFSQTASTAASTAQQQASNASGSASTASQSAATAATYRDQAQGHASSASSSASTASSAASVATAQASAAQQSATLAASIGQGALNINPAFADYPNATGAPTGYSVYGSPIHTTRMSVTNGPSPYAVAQGVTAGTQAGLLQLSPAGGQLFDVQPGWFVVEADFVLNGGTLSGAGIYVPAYDGSGTSGVIVDSTARISFTQELGTASPGIGTMQRIRKLVRIAHPNMRRLYLYLMTGWPSFVPAETVTAKTIIWYRAGIRPATQGEIEAMRVAPLEATVTQQGQVLATQEGTLASLTSTVNSQGLTVSQVQQSVDGMAGRWAVAIDANGRVVGRVRLDGNQTTSRFVVSANAFEVENPGGGDGLSWTTDANGRGTLRVRSGNVNVIELGWVP